MPYSKVSDLPDSVKNNIPIEAQRIWLNAFNFAYSKKWDESRCAKYAWGSVSRRFHKNKEGEWVKLKLSTLDEAIDFIMF